MQATKGKPGSGTGTTSTSSMVSYLSEELRTAAFHIDPKDVVVEQDAHGHPLLLGKGAFGAVRLSACSRGSML